MAHKGGGHLFRRRERGRGAVLGLIGGQGSLSLRLHRGILLLQGRLGRGGGLGEGVQDLRLGLHDGLHHPARSGRAQSSEGGVKVGLWGSASCPGRHCAETHLVTAAATGSDATALATVLPRLEVHWACARVPQRPTARRMTSEARIGETLRGRRRARGEGGDKRLLQDPLGGSLKGGRGASLSSVNSALPGSRGVPRIPSPRHLQPRGRLPQGAEEAPKAGALRYSPPLQDHRPPPAAQRATASISLRRYTGVRQNTWHGNHESLDCSVRCRGRRAAAGSSSSGSGALGPVPQRPDFARRLPIHCQHFHPRGSIPSLQGQHQLADAELVGTGGGTDQRSGGERSGSAAASKAGWGPYTAVANSAELCRCRPSIVRRPKRPTQRQCPPPSLATASPSPLPLVGPLPPLPAVLYLYWRYLK